MLKHSEFHIHWTIQPLYQFSRKFSIWPYKYEDDYNIAPLNTRDKCISYTLIIIILTYLSWSIYGRIKYVYKNDLSVTTVTDILFGLPLFILISITLYLSTTNKYYTLTQSFYEQLNSIAKHDLQFTETDYSDLRNLFLYRAVVFFIFNILTQIADFILLYEIVGLLESLYYVGNYVIHNFMVIIFFQVKFQARILQECFEHLNKKLTNFHFSTTQLALNNSGKNESFFDEKALYIRKLCFTYKKLCDSIEVVNVLYGLQILLLVCCIITIVLNALFYSLITGLGKRFPGNHGGLEIAICCNQIIVAVIHLVLTIIIFGQCSTATKEAIKSGAVANELLLEVSMESKCNSISLYRKQLKLLVQEVHCRDLKFSAAGFFTVDYSVVLTILGAVGSYLIILLQFTQPAQKHTDLNILNSTYAIQNTH